MNNQDIKDTIRMAADEIPVPDSLTPGEIEKKVKDHPQKHPRILFMNRRVLMAAASFLLLAVVGFGVLPKMTALFQGDSDEIVVTEEYVTETKESKSMPEDYEELCKHIKNRNQSRYYESFGSGGGAAADVAESSASENSLSDSIEYGASSSQTDTSYSETDLQVKGIMEADIVKTDGSNIYALSGMENGFRVRIYSVNGADVKKISTIQLKKSSCSEMYLEGKTLILLCTDWGSTDTGNEKQSATEDDYVTTCSDVYPTNQTTNIRFYDVSAPKNPRELRCMSQSGNYSTSRISGGYLQQLLYLRFGSVYERVSKICTTGCGQLYSGG